MSQMVLVPQSDIDAIEQARKDLFEMLPEAYYSRLVFQITDKLWHLTHRRYKVLCES